MECKILRDTAGRDADGNLIPLRKGQSGIFLDWQIVVDEYGRGTEGVALYIKSAKSEIIVPAAAVAAIE